MRRYLNKSQLLIRPGARKNSLSECYFSMCYLSLGRTALSGENVFNMQINSIMATDQRLTCRYFYGSHVLLFRRKGKFLSPFFVPIAVEILFLIEQISGVTFDQ